MLTIENLSVSYGNIRALHGINLSIEDVQKQIDTWGRYPEEE